MSKVYRATFTIVMPDGDGPPTVRVDLAPLEHGRPGDGSPGAPGPPPRASGGVNVEVDDTGDAPAVKAVALLKQLGEDNPMRIMATYKTARVIEVCESAVRRGAKLKNPPGWVRRALQYGWKV